MLLVVSARSSKYACFVPDDLAAPAYSSREPGELGQLKTALDPALQCLALSAAGQCALTGADVAGEAGPVVRRSGECVLPVARRRTAP